MKVHTRNCAKFQADPELAKLLPSRRYKSSASRKTAEPLMKDAETVNITIKVEPTDVDIKVEPEDVDDDDMDDDEDDESE